MTYVPMLYTRFAPDPTDPDRHHADLLLAAAPQAARTARRFVLAHLQKWDLEQLADACELVTSELITNAITASHAHSLIAARLRLTWRRLILEIWDHSDQQPIPSYAGPLDDNGRGLLLVATYATGYTHHPSPAGGKVVRTWWNLPTTLSDEA